jgi:hypothetical protein
MPTDLGKTWSHWLVVADAPAERDGKHRVQVRCPTCGVERVMRLSKLKAGGYNPCAHGVKPQPFGRVR